MIALATTSRGARSASSCTPCMNRFALEVDEEGALAADRLGDQRLLAAGVGAEVHHGRVELHELEVAQRRAGAQRERHAVAGGDRRVGGLGEDLAEPAAGQHDGPAADRADAVALALAHHVQGHAGDAAVRGEQQVDGERVLDDLDLGRRARPRRSAPAGSRRRWRRRRRARSGRGGGRPRGSATARRRGRGRSWCRARSARAPPRGPRCTSTRTASRSQAPAPATRVSTSCCSGVSPGPSAAAMPPCAHWVEPAASTSLVTTRTLSTWPREAQRGGQPGDAGADDDDVGRRSSSRARGRSGGRGGGVRGGGHRAG